MDFFESWLLREENHLFWEKPIPSEIMDRALVDANIQKAIASKEQHRSFHAYIEHTIAQKYARLVNHLLVSSFKKIPIQDFNTLDGFERSEHRSLEQAHYFEVRNHLEYFLKQDIKQHLNADAKLSAFRRWIDIANQLEQMGCYEGLTLVFTNLKLIEKPHLLNGLPECTRKTFERLSKLTSEEKNFSALRGQLLSPSKNKAFYPVFLWLKDIRLLKESIIGLENQETELHARKLMLRKEIRHSRSRHKLFDLYHQRALINSQIDLIHFHKKDQLVQLSQIYDAIAHQQNVPIPKMRRNQERTYLEIVDRYHLTNEKDRKNNRSPETSARVLPPSDLYRGQLVPSFWARKGKSCDKYWQQFFSVGSSPSK